MLIKDSIDKDVLFIDVRAPSEYEVDHVPNAIHIPVLDDEERKQVGIAYRKNEDNAMDIGLEYYSKKLPKLVSFIKKLDKKKKAVVYCWRGGKRSKAMVQLFDLLGFDAYQLTGGHKAYRAYVMEELAKVNANFIKNCRTISSNHLDFGPNKFIVLYGFAGVGKTELIKKLNNSIDLEGLAQHRSSVFGSIGLKPRKQKLFESLMLDQFKKLNGLIFIEGESRKIGDIQIPDNIFKMIKKGINIKVNRSMDNRVKQIMKDYFIKPDKEEIKKIILSLKQNLGKKMMDEFIELVESDNYKELSQRLLEEYYDDLYKHTINNVKYSYEVNNDDLDECLKQLEKIFHENK